MVTYKNSRSKTVAPPKPMKISDCDWLFAYRVVYGVGLSSSFKEAYPKRAAKLTASSTYQAGVNLKEKPNVKKQIELIRTQILAEEKLLPEQHMAKLKQIRDAALEKGNFTAAIRAEELRGKCAGFYIERSMSLEVKMSEAEIIDRLKQLSAANPDVAALIAGGAGIVPIQVEAPHQAEAPAAHDSVLVDEKPAETPPGDLEGGELKRVDPAHEKNPPAETID